jgi:hypothetical protein
MASDPDAEVLRQRLDALVKDGDATEAKAAATQRRVQAALLLLEEEQAVAVAAKGLLPAPSSSSATSDMVDGAACDSALVSNLHVQARHSSNHCISRLHLFLLRAGHPRMAQAGTSSCSPTPSAPWRFSQLLPWSRTGSQTPACRTTPLRQLVISLKHDL